MLSHPSTVESDATQRKCILLEQQRNELHEFLSEVQEKNNGIPSHPQQKTIWTLLGIFRRTANEWFQEHKNIILGINEASRSKKKKKS